MMSDNGEWRSYVLKARRTLVKSWLFSLLLCEQDMVHSYKSLVFHCKVAMEELGGEKKHLQYNITDLFPDISTVLDRWNLNSKHTHTHTHTHTHKHGGNKYFILIFRVSVTLLSYTSKLLGETYLSKRFWQKIILEY